VSQPTVLLIGSTDRHELAEAGKVLQSLAKVIPAPDCDAAASVLADEQLAVDLIVVAQAYPGQFPAEAMERLARLAPLARVVAMLGSWCEGETRSGRPWPGAVRVCWHQWPPRCYQELSRFHQGLCSSWGLPPTAAEEERFLALADGPLPRCQGLIAIHSQSFDAQDWLSKACRRAGYSTLWLRPGEVPHVDGAQAAIFDAIDCRGEELDELRRLIATLQPAPTIVLMSFPRVEDRDRALAAGASALLSKPVLLEDLFWQLRQVTGCAAADLPQRR
jgi:DNA-binding NarL/FixJ family response regulator